MIPLRIIRSATLAAVAAGVLACVLARAAEAPKPAAAKTVSSIRINPAGTARWTETTHEAASGAANKKVLAAGRPMTVTGEVVDVSCYLQLGKRGEAHIACGSKCLEHGEPIGLVDSRGVLYLLFAEEHHPRRDGMVDIRKVFAPHLARWVTVTGMVSDMRGVRGMFVRAAELDGKAVPMDETKP